MKKTLFSPKTTLPLLYHCLRWHLHWYLRRQGFPLACGVFLTNICNLKCRMCSIWADRKKATLSVEQVRHLVDAFTPGLCYLSFSGGEPLLVERLSEMIAYAARRIPYVHLVSNGLMLDAATARELARAGLKEISISLDGDRQWHNWIRGHSRSFDAAIEAIETIRRYTPTMDVVVNSVMFPEAPHQVEKALALTRDLGVKHKIQPVNTHFQFDQIRRAPADIRFEAVDSESIRALLQGLARQSHLINSRAFLRRIGDYFDRRLKCPMIRPRCLLPHFFVEANAYGRLSPCMVATGWEGGALTIDSEVGRAVRSKTFDAEKKQLEECRMCDHSMYICYWEPMISFPIGNFIRYSLAKQA